MSGRHRFLREFMRRAAHSLTSDRSKENTLARAERLGFHPDMSEYEWDAYDAHARGDEPPGLDDDMAMLIDKYGIAPPTELFRGENPKNKLVLSQLMDGQRTKYLAPTSEDNRIAAAFASPASYSTHADMIDGGSPGTLVRMQSADPKLRGLPIIHPDFPSEQEWLLPSGLKVRDIIDVGGTNPRYSERMLRLEKRYGGRVSA